MVRSFFPSLESPEPHVLLDRLSQTTLFPIHRPILFGSNRSFQEVILTTTPVNSALG